MQRIILSCNYIILYYIIIHIYHIIITKNNIFEYIYVFTVNFSSLSKRLIVYIFLKGIGNNIQF